jgi:predicted dehydrogenase
MQTWLIGVGPMGREYYKVMKALGEPVKVIGRSDQSAAEFKALTGQSVCCESLSINLQTNGAPERAIVAVSIDNLYQVASALIGAGTKRILLEKPGALNRSQIMALSDLASSEGATVVIGYNRRFYAATLAAEAMIAEDGGATSCTFKFTEWANTITPLKIAAETKDLWMYANSSHVPDLAFYLCGTPTELVAFHGGGLDWHRSASQFVGAGITNKGVFFSYHADWEAPGRWGIEVMTKKRRYIFRPMERLQINLLSTTSIEMASLDYSLDEIYKPGLFLQTKAFLAGEDERFCTLTEQINNLTIYAKISGYTS